MRLPVGASIRLFCRGAILCGLVMLWAWGGTAAAQTPVAMPAPAPASLPPPPATPLPDALPAPLASSAGPTAGIPPASSSPSPTASSTAKLTLSRLLLDNVLIASLLLIFLGATITAVLNARRIDRVLKEFRGYHVHAALRDGRRIWGNLAAYPNGIELRYRRPYRNTNGMLENSFILYQSEYNVVRAIVRLNSDLTDSLRKRRLEELRRYYYPTLPRRFWRWSLKQLAILRDAYVKSLTVILGQAKKAAGASSMAATVLTTQDQRLTEIGTTVIGAVNLAHDPILERFFGRWVVAEIKEDTGWREILGVLKEYSAEWIELLEAAWPRELEVVLEAGHAEMDVPDANCRLRREGDQLIIENRPPEALEILEARIGTEIRALGHRRIAPADSFRVALGEFSDAEVRLRLCCLEPADLILPRSLALIRHCGPKEQQTWRQAIGLSRAVPKRHKWLRRDGEV